MCHGSVTVGRLRAMQHDLLDHVAADAREDPELTTSSVRNALLTAAECANAVLALGCFPDGDWDIPLPLVAEVLTSDEQSYDEGRDPAQAAATAGTWVDAFALSLISGMLWDWAKMLGPLLRDDYAPAIRDGVPYSRWESVSAPADLAEMDALADYLYVVKTARSPWVAQGPVPVRKPDAEQREQAAKRLDAAGTLSADQQLLRVLLDDDRPRFEQALVERLIAHRRGLETDPAARSLLPVRTIARTALAVLAHGWTLGVRSDYLPTGLLRAPHH